MYNVFTCTSPLHARRVSPQLQPLCTFARHNEATMNADDGTGLVRLSHTPCPLCACVLHVNPGGCLPQPVVVWKVNENLKLDLNGNPVAPLLCAAYNSSDGATLRVCSARALTDSQVATIVDDVKKHLGSPPKADVCVGACRHACCRQLAACLLHPNQSHPHLSRRANPRWLQRGRGDEWHRNSRLCFAA